MNKQHKFGQVVFIGAGPGDPELLTIKALRFLEKADVILTDRLASPEIIEKYANPSADVVYVGKQCSKGIFTPQEEINQLMVEFALQGQNVVRLKGGDATLFSNILDELQILKENNVEYIIIPGVSAAFGAASYTGIPLTARGYSRGVRFQTLYDVANVTSEQWKDWVSTEDTLVFYMSGQRIKKLITIFNELNVSNEKQIAIVEQATTVEQKTTIYNFSDIEQNFPSFDFVPTLIIIGKVVQLHEQFKWFAEKENTISYFDNHLKNIQYAS
jgi:uroporphyrin-III C-methyltransferase